VTLTTPNIVGSSGDGSEVSGDLSADNLAGDPCRNSSGYSD
jgi:hypothetical protein